jgi:hypothetical protein
VSVLTAVRLVVGDGLLVPLVVVFSETITYVWSPRDTVVTRAV